MPLLLLLGVLFVEPSIISFSNHGLCLEGFEAVVSLKPGNKWCTAVYIIRNMLLTVIYCALIFTQSLINERGECSFL